MSNSKAEADAFELKRMMRQEAHEKAFEFQVLGQRNFEVERDRLVNNGNEKLEREFSDKMNKIEVEHKIVFSKKSNETRILKMNCRNEQLKKLLEEVKNKVKTDLAFETDAYKETLKDMIVQGMIRLLEERVELKVREDQVDLFNEIIPECQEKYSQIMMDATDREYQTELVVIDDKFLTEREGAEFGGCIMLCHQRRIVVSNTLLDRVNLTFESALPGIREILFEEKKHRK